MNQGPNTWTSFVSLQARDPEEAVLSAWEHCRPAIEAHARRRLLGIDEDTALDLVADFFKDQLVKASEEQDTILAKYFRQRSEAATRESFHAYLLVCFHRYAVRRIQRERHRQKLLSENVPPRQVRDYERLLARLTLNELRAQVSGAFAEGSLERAILDRKWPPKLDAPVPGWRALRGELGLSESVLKRARDRLELEIGLALRDMLGRSDQTLDRLARARSSGLITGQGKIALAKNLLAELAESALDHLLTESELADPEAHE